MKGVAGSGTGAIRARVMDARDGGIVESSVSEKAVAVQGTMVKRKEAPVNGDWLLSAIGGGAVVQQSVCLLSLLLIKNNVFSLCC